MLTRPELQHAIKLLQLSHAELIDEIHESMLANPLIEEQLETTRDYPYPVDIEEAEGYIDGQSCRHLKPVIAETKASGRAMRGELFLQSFPSESSSWAQSEALRSEDHAQETNDPIQGQAGSLFEYMMRRVQRADFTEDEFVFAMGIVGRLDDAGYLVSCTLEELASKYCCSVAEVEKVLFSIQEMGPLGVGARDLRECLLIQASALYPNDRLLRRVIFDHMSDSARCEGRLSLERRNLSIEDFNRCERIIFSLDPHPGLRYRSDNPCLLVPDLYVHKQGKGYAVTVNQDDLPKLKISNIHQNTSRDYSGDGQDDIEAKFKSALWLIRSLDMRRRTIKKVTESIFRFQRRFLDHGPRFLAPLTLHDVARDIGMHEVTIERVIANKVVQSSQGIHELKDFFYPYPEADNVICFSSATRKRTL